jgi:thiol-disulfide isomerase/thioredoxin
MRIFLFFLILTTFILESAAQVSECGKINITWHPKPLTDLPNKVIIQYGGLSRTTSISHPLQVKNGGIDYQINAPEPIFIKLIFYWKARSYTKISFWAEPCNYVIQLDKDFVPQISSLFPTKIADKITAIEGEADGALAISETLIKNIDYQNRNIEDVEERIHFIKDSMNSNIDQKIYKKYAESYSNSPVGLFALWNYAERPYGNQRIKSDPDMIAQLFEALDSAIQEKPTAKVLLGKLGISNRMAVGKPFINIILPDTNNRPVDLQTFKGNYVLFDFWASWCTPCRKESPNLIKLYKKYKSLGLQIVGISRDKKSDKSSWLQAIKEDGTNLWAHLLDNDNIAEKTYAIRFVPANFLVDPNGVIIARDLRGENLESVLKTIFKF